MFDLPSDNFENCKPSTRDFVTCGPCKPHEASTNHMPMLNLRKLLGLI